MATLSTADRAKLPDRAFAYIDAAGRRRLPIHDESHVRNALARFERVRFESDAARERARRRLLQAAKRYGIVPVGFIDGQLRSERRSRAPDPGSLPAGTVTFLMTDIEGSTALVRSLGGGYAPVLREVRGVIRNAVRGCGGVAVDTHGDETLSAFARGPSGLEAAIDVQRSIAAHGWPDGVEVRVRCGLHRGRPTVSETGYVGVAVHTVARVCAAGHGGQIVVSDALRTHLASSLPPGVELKTLGSYRLAGLPRPIGLSQVHARGLRRRFPELRVG